MRIIAGDAKGRRIEAPAGRNTRPTLDRVRENLFNMIQYEVADRRVLDLFAGSGALSLEALSRGAAFAVLSDLDRGAGAVQRRNAESLRYADRTRIMTCDWRRAVQTLRAEGERFSLVFLDPPYAMTDLREVFDALSPLLDPDALIVLEHEAKKKPLTGPGFDCVKEREWGFCGVSIYRPGAGGHREESV